MPCHMQSTHGSSKVLPTLARPSAGYDVAVCWCSEASEDCATRISLPEVAFQLPSGVGVDASLPSAALVKW